MEPSAYPAVPRLASEQPGTPAAEAALRSLLSDLAGRKEFCATRARPDAGPAPPVAGFGDPGRGAQALFLPGLRLHGAQLFVRNLGSPDTPWTRLFVNWQTGTGKSIAAASLGHEFSRQFRARAALGEQPPSVFVISFTARETLQEEMLRYPEFGFVSQAEAEELRRLRAAAAAAGPASAEAHQLSGFTGTLRRRFTDRARGGYYRFYGYKEFASHLFAVTRQGAARGFAVEALYARDARAEGGFGERLASAVRRGDVVVNEDLLADLRGGLLIADEIHNAYNIQSANNYGIAIQYALDALGDEAPRAVYLSATPMTGSAAEAVDLLNLLVPRGSLPGGMPLRRADFFARYAAPEDADGFVVSQLREGALERIAHLAAGRVSFLLDSDVGSYPRRLFVGEETPAVPYLRLTPCPMSPFHARTLARAQGRDADARGLPAGAHTLYDMAFPNPEFAPDAAMSDDPATYGLYRGDETPARLAQAPEEWRAAAGVVVEKGAEAGVAPGAYVISGAFLGPGRLPHYSAKLARAVAEAVAAVRAGPGKIMIYSHRVRMSGALLDQEALRMNGFADETSPPTDATLCGVCGVPRAEHGGAAHPYTPARFVVAHGDVDRALMFRSIARYNAASNLEGHQYRVLVGSKIVREGLNFRGVRHLLVVAFPTDFPTLVQVFGRVVRKDSHADLPEDQRDVRIRVLVSTRADGRPSPELQRYADKGREYLVIQEVERAFRRYALDGFANYLRVRAALHSGPGGELRPSLDSLPYSPVVGPDDARCSGAARATFEAYGHGEREVATVAAACRALFRARPVWTYADLWAALRSGAVRGVGYDPALFDEGNFALALEDLARPAGDPPAVVVQAGRFYVRALAGPGGRPALDVESYLRDPGLRGPARVAVRVADYLRGARADENFAIRLRAFEETYLRPEAPAPLELSLVEYGASFHYALLRRLVVAAGSVTADDARVAGLYRRFRVAVAVGDAAAPAAARVFRGAPGRAAESLIGYLTPEAVTLYDPGAAAWYSAPHADFGVGRRHRENDIVVGFVVSVGEAPRAEALGASFAASSASARFKIRPPVQQLRARAATAGDVRALARGAVCETRPRAELETYAARLRGALAARGPAERGAAARGRVSPTAAGVCDALRLLLLALEEQARAPADGMASGVRWLYLFSDRPPTISALTG